MAAQLLSLSDGPSLLLDKPILLVGRHEECDIQLNSRKISRKHCVIAQVGETLLVHDLGSTNGVRVNGVRVDDATLKTGDELVIGNFRYQIHVDQRRDMVEPPAPPVSKAAGAPNHPVSEDDILEAADEPVPLPEPGEAEPRADGSYPMPPELRVKADTSPPPAVD